MCMCQGETVWSDCTKSAVLRCLLASRAARPGGDKRKGCHRAEPSGAKGAAKGLLGPGIIRRGLVVSKTLADARFLSAYEALPVSPRGAARASGVHSMATPGLSSKLNYQERFAKRRR